MEEIIRQEKPDAVPALAEDIGYPVLLKHSFVLGGSNMAIVHSRPVSANISLP